MITRHRQRIKTQELLNHTIFLRRGIIKGTINKNGRMPTLEYPCRWTYKVIGSDREEMEKVIGEIIQGCNCTITPSHTSRSGLYHCLNVEILVHDEGHRTGVYEQLRGHPVIKMVL